MPSSAADLLPTFHALWHAIVCVCVRAWPDKGGMHHSQATLGLWPCAFVDALRMDSPTHAQQIQVPRQGVLVLRQAHGHTCPLALLTAICSHAILLASAFGTCVPFQPSGRAAWKHLRR